jgi:hypothetical protein
VTYLSGGTSRGPLHFAGITNPGVSALGNGRVYFDSVANKFRVSENNGAYVDLVQAQSLQSAYNGGATIVETGAVPVAISSTTADNGDVLQLTKNPGAAHSGNALTISMGANTTGDAVEVDGSGSGQLLRLRSSAVDKMTVDTSGNTLVAGRIDATTAAVLSLGTVNATSLGIGTASGTTSSFQVFINQGGASFNSNAGLQLSSTVANRGSGRFNQFGANAGVPGITGFKSRGTNVGDLASVADGDILARMTAIGVAADNASIPLAGFVDVRVPTGGTNSNWVASDFSVSLVPLAGPINSIRQVLRITSEAAFELIDGTTAAVSPATKGQLRYNNTTKTFQQSVDGGPWTSLVTTASVSLQSAYDGGATITETGGTAVAISSTTADDGDVLQVTKNPSSSHAGVAISVSMGANSTGNAINVDSAGSGSLLNLKNSAATRLSVAPSGATIISPSAAAGTTIRINQANNSNNALAIFDSGSNLVMELTTGGVIVPATSSGSWQVNPAILYQSGGASFNFSGSMGDNGVSSNGTFKHLALEPSVNFTNSTGAYDALIVNPTEISAPPGPNYLARFQLGGSDRLTLDTAGNTTLTGKLAVTGQYYSAQFACTTTVDWNDGNAQAITLANGNNTFTFANAQAGGRYLLKLKQPASGAAGTATWPGTVLWSGGTAPTLTTTNDKTDIVTLYYDGTNFFGGYTLNY